MCPFMGRCGRLSARPDLGLEQSSRVVVGGGSAKEEGSKSPQCWAEVGQGLALLQHAAWGIKAPAATRDGDAAVKGTEAATAALYSHRYRAFRDRDGNLTLTYWQLLAVRLGFVIMFEVPAAGPGLSAGAGGEDLPPRPTCTSPLTSSTWFSLLDV